VYRIKKGKKEKERKTKGKIGKKIRKIRRKKGKMGKKVNFFFKKRTKGKKRKKKISVLCFLMISDDFCLFFQNQKLLHII